MSTIFQRRNLANIISISRLGFLPFIVLAGLFKQPELFVGLFAVQLFCDTIDGFVARRMHIESDLGRWLDTVIDMGIWFPSLALFVWLAWDDLSTAFADYPHLFIIPTLTSILMYATAYRYLHTVSAMHLYSAKLAGGFVLLLMLTMLLDRFHPLIGYLAACAGIIYHLEAITIYALKKSQTDENVISILQVLRG